jgi:hypothetical protein
MVFRDQKWLPIDPASDSPLEYLNLDRKTQMIVEPFTKRAEFWKNIGLI